MIQCVYTVNEIDELRRVVEERCEFGSCAPTQTGRVSRRSYMPGELEREVEEKVRTHMLAGHVAQDLINADIEKESERKRKIDEIIGNNSQSR